MAGVSYGTDPSKRERRRKAWAADAERTDLRHARQCEVISSGKRKHQTGVHY